MEENCLRLESEIRKSSPRNASWLVANRIEALLSFVCLLGSVLVMVAVPPKSQLVGAGFFW